MIRSIGSTLRKQVSLNSIIFRSAASFAKTPAKGKRGRKPGSRSGGSESEGAPVKRTPVAKAAEDELRVVESVAGNKAPSREDTIQGRYASTLFQVASQEGNLYKVYQDMSYLRELYRSTESFRIFADNSGLGANQINSLSEEIGKLGEFSTTTLKFLG